MPLSILFWIVIVLTLITGFLQAAMGYELLGTFIFLIIADFIVLGASLETEKRKHKEGSKIATRLEGIERACAGIFEHITGNPNPGLGISKKQSEGINYLLDKMAKRALTIEERLNQFGETLAASVTRLDERVRSLERGGRVETEEVETVEEPVAEETVEEVKPEEQTLEEPSSTEEVSSSEETESF